MRGLWCHREYDRRLTDEEAVREDFSEEVLIELRAGGLAGLNQAKQQVVGGPGRESWAGE